MPHDPLVHDIPTSLESSSTSTIPMSAPLTVKIKDPPPPSLRMYTRHIKSTNLPNFPYSTYLGSFASFIANIHHLSEP